MQSILTAFISVVSRQKVENVKNTSKNHAYSSYCLDFIKNFQKFNYKCSRLCIIKLSIAKKVNFMDPSPCAGLLYISISANHLGVMN